MTKEILSSKSEIRNKTEIRNSKLQINAERARPNSIFEFVSNLGLRISSFFVIRHSGFVISLQESLFSSKAQLGLGIHGRLHIPGHIPQDLRDDVIGGD